LLALTRGLQATGRYDITVAFFKEEAQEARSLVEDFRALGVRVMDLRMPRRFAPSGLARLNRLFREGRFEIVHTHLIRADILGALCGSFHRVPVRLATVHNTERFYERPFVRAAVRLAFRPADKVIAISDSVRRVLVDRVGLPASKVERIDYGLTPRPGPQPDRDVRREFGIGPEDFLVGTVGRIAKQKGHRVLLEAMRRVRAALPDRRVKLLIVGHDDEGLRPSLEAWAERLGLAADVRFAGFQEDVAAFLRSFDLFVLPSLWEGFGLILLEAMEQARAVVASRVDAIREVVVHGETGLLVPPGDAERLAEAIVELIRDDGRRAAMGRAGRARQEAEFSLDRMIQRTDELYRGLAERKGIRA
ncbi:MAG: glycosyltransferase, partial [Nitrospinota bacterium]